LVRKEARSVSVDRALKISGDLPLDAKLFEAVLARQIS